MLPSSCSSLSAPSTNGSSVLFSVISCSSVWKSSSFCCSLIMSVFSPVSFSCSASTCSEKSSSEEVSESFKSLSANKSCSSSNKVFLAIIGRFNPECSIVISSILRTGGRSEDFANNGLTAIRGLLLCSIP